MIWVVASAVVAACLVSMVLTALMRVLGPRVGLVDCPDGTRKLHKGPTALGGGVAVFLATAGVLAALLILPNPAGMRLQEDMPEYIFLFLAALVIVLLGVVDDRWGMRGRHKLLGQLVAVSILVSAGLVIERIGLFGWEIEMGVLAVPFTLFWLLGAINALNLLDGLDGLASTIGIIVSATIAAMAMVVGKTEAAIVAAVFAGSLVGFLRFNFPPATIFLGDAGSMLIGLVIGTLSIHGSLKGLGTVLLAAPLAALTIPVLDSVGAILRRTLRGRSIYFPDRSHIHHRLLGLLKSNRKVLLFVGLCCALTSGAALVSVLIANDVVAVVAFLGVVMVFVTTGIFGRAELLMLGVRLRNVGGWLIPFRRAGSARERGACVRFCGARTWELLWETLTESIDRLGLNGIQLDISLPAADEGCHAFWKRGSHNEHDWCLHYPLVVNGRQVGSLKVNGSHNGHPRCEGIQQLMEMIEPFEKEVLAIAGVPEPDALAELPAGNHDHLDRSEREPVAAGIADAE